LYVDPEERAVFQAQVELKGAVMAHPVRLRSRDGREMECLLTSTARRDDSGQLVGYQGIVEDVTSRLETERALRASEGKFRSLIEGASDTITIVDQAGTIIYESPSLERLLGWRADELIGQTVFDFVHHDDLPEALGQFHRIMERGGEVGIVEVRFKHKDGSWRTLEAVGRNLLHDPDVAGVIINARDITERKKAEARLVHDAFHDKLTQLPNRALFMDRVNQFIGRRRRKDSAPFAVLFLDLDRFKLVNDSLGHMMGDQLLMALARRLRDSLRPGDTVARLGGDEFTMLLDQATRADAEQVAERVQADLQEPFILGAHQIYTAMSMGIATSSDRYATAEEMIRDADVAMYRAKDGGGARSKVFDSSMRAAAVARLELDTDLRKALEREEFLVYYQPIIEFGSGALHGFEALIRWNHPERGLLRPAAFLKAAEETGLIVPMGWWVLEHVCKQLAEWADPESPATALPVHVNVSAQQLALPELVDRVAGAVERAGTPAGLLHLELTESTMMENAEATVQTLHRLRESQVGLAIDDFGTGFSSLSYLHRFPTESVKIDRSFVSRMDKRGRDFDIVRTIIDLARDLSMRVVAEGIETEAQAAALRAMRCDCGQGYLFARPQPVEEATRLLLTQPTW
jgi:diguanylate cyclase (GGDEF)-like protein/PAS domain S-box-containing protein